MLRQIATRLLYTLPVLWLVVSVVFLLIHLVPGDPVTITFDALPGRPFRGKVISVAPSGTLSQGVVTYPVSISIDNRNVALPGGLTASATIIIDEKNDVLVVPLRAVRRQGREQTVEVVGDDGSCGTLVTLNSPSSLAAAIRDLISEPARRTRTGQLARARVHERFSLAAMQNAYARLVARHVAVGPARP